MRLVIKINDTDYVLTADQMAALVNLLAETEALVREYLGASVPEADRFLPMVVPPTHQMVGPLKADLMNDARYAALVATHKMRSEVKK